MKGNNMLFEYFIKYLIACGIGFNAMMIWFLLT